MNSIILAVMNALHRGQVLAAAVPASEAGYLAWVGVYPLNLGSAATQEFLRNQDQVIPPGADRAYRIRLIEVQERLIDDDVSISEPDLKNQANEFAYDDDQLLAALAILGVKFETLALPYKSNYPI